AMGDDGFETTEETAQLSPGDTMFMLTDGLFEARDRRGEQFGLQRLASCVSRAEPPADWADHLIELVQGWRNRMADDDLLVATLRWEGSTARSPSFAAARSPLHEAVS
ncbi:MAG: SpoIIE family protein phosphatase, partial [Planctomycetota bacterium]